MSKGSKVKVNKVKDSPSTLALLPEVEAGKVPDAPQSDGKPALETTTLWDYPKQSYGKTPKGNNKFQGVTPAFIIWNLVQRYTQPDDLVVDPMAGSGTRPRRTPLSAPSWC